MKRETNTITNRGKHMSYGVGSYITFIDTKKKEILNEKRNKYDY